MEELQKIQKENQIQSRFTQTGTKDYKEQFKNHTDGTKIPIDMRSDEDSNNSE